MAIPKADDILALSPDSVAAFIAQHRRDKTLSSLVRALNAELIEGDLGSMTKARAALERMGLLDVA